MDSKIGCIRMGLVAYEHAEMYSREVANILSNSFLSDFESAFLNSFHSHSSYICASLNDGTVRPMLLHLYHLEHLFG